MPRTKNGHNQTHDLKQPKNRGNSHTFIDNRAQQEHLAKHLLRNEKKQKIEENRLRMELAKRQRELQNQQGIEQNWLRKQKSLQHLLDLERRDPRQSALHSNLRMDDLHEEIYEAKVWHRAPDHFALNFLMYLEENNRPFVAADRERPVNEDNRFNPERRRI